MVKVTQWRWEEAFCKFGFEDGDGWNGTHLVERFIREKFNYDCEVDAWGCHNYMIFNIRDKDKNNVINEAVNIGYDDPLQYLPKNIIEALNKEFPYHNYSEWEIESNLNDK